MTLDDGRNLMQGIMVLVFLAIAALVSVPVGLGLVAFMAVMKLQQTFTDWCPSDLILKPLGLRSRLQPKR
ncbi:MAG: DUF2892 domain-containing protein [Chloroflexi bacterium]|nr:DUF2892 domain-containing protein [Chloroflexota bacterium]